MRETVPLGEASAVAYAAKAKLGEAIILGRASCLVQHKRPARYIQLPKSRGSLMVPDLDSYALVSDPEEVWNVITNSGRDFLHSQGYATSGIGANGLNYIAQSNDAVTETATSTVLSNEIAVNGLSRAQGTVAHTAGTNTSTVDKTFTATGSQSTQKAALFTASSAGTMCHVLGFTQRGLITNDTIQLTYTITLG